MPRRCLTNRIVTLNERTLTTTVDDIEHIESQSLNGVAVVKIFLQPTAKIEKAIRPGHGNFTNPAAAVARRNHATPWLSATARPAFRFCSGPSAARVCQKAVEDNLAALRILNDEAKAQEDAGRWQRPSTRLNSPPSATKGE
jgi:hypothetical protein